MSKEEKTAKEFIMPKSIISGSNALIAASEAMAKLGNKAMIVTDEMMIKLGNCQKIEILLKSLEKDYYIFSKINSEPNNQMIEEGVAQYKKEDCDFMIALGGGSPIDAMKAMAALVENGGNISDYMGKVIDTKRPPMVAIPTTAGTGSEATQFTIITDTEKNIKMLLKGSVLIPDVAIIDPQFTMTAPPSVTAATGLDALCHAIEAYTSKKSQSLSDTFALSAVKRIFKYLPIAYKDGNNEEARIEMSIAALEAGIAFNNSSVTLIHGMSRPIGALFHVPHGLSNAMLMKSCLAFAQEGAIEEFAMLAQVIDAVDQKENKEEAGKKFLKAVDELINQLNIPTMESYGIDKTIYFDMIDKMSKDAMDSGSPQNTRRLITQEDVKLIYRSNY